jgi:RNA polymerase-binding transcription factor DksA
MADDIDLANDLIANEVSRALSKMRLQSEANAKGAKFCVECDDPIPLARQKLGFKFCVPCAEENERRKSLFIE